MIVLALLLGGAFFVVPVRAQDTGIQEDARTEGMEDYPVVKLQSLDKSTARTMTFEVRVGSTVKFGPLYIKVDACRKSSPLERPESASFLQIWEVTKDQEAHWIFSGWMFASSPALSAMDHPIYDVWVLDCLDKKTGTGDEIESESESEADADQNTDEQPGDPAAAKDDEIESEKLAPAGRSED